MSSLITADEKRFFKKLFEDGAYDGACSPDLALLQQRYWFVPVFVYGPEKHGMSLHKLMRGFPRIGIGFTHENIFVMRTHRGDPFVFCEPQNEEAKGKVQGELYSVSPSVLNMLDNEYENVSFTRRASRWIRYYTPDQKDAEKKTLRLARAWMFTAFSPQWDSRRAALRPVGKFRNDKIGSYYQFTPGLDNLRDSM